MHDTYPAAENRGIARCICPNAILTIEAAVVLPFVACFLVFILYFFRILQVQGNISQALQYAGRHIAAEYSSHTSKDTTPGTADTDFQKPEILADEQESHADFPKMLKAKLLFEKQLKKQGCPTQYIRHGTAGISLLQSDFSEDYVQLKAVYKMKLPVTLFGNIHYQIVQEAKCRKWTGFTPAEHTDENDTWLYYTEHGTVYHASRSCTHLDLSIRGITYAQAGSSRNKSGGKYYKCEKCEDTASGSSMVYITDYGNRYHNSLTCSGLKRSIYMIRKSKATDKRMCSKCGS